MGLTESLNEKFDELLHLKLLNKAMRAMPGSPKQRDIIKKLNVVRKAGGMKPLKETAFVDLDERSKGRLRPAALLRRKAAMAGKRAQIARRRA